MGEWNTFALLEALQEDFEAALLRAATAAQSHRLSLPMAMAIEGFTRFQPALHWTQQPTDWILQRLDGELSLEALNWHEECAPAVAAFSCFALGALQGKFAAGEIEAAGFMLGEAHLTGFVFLHSEQICAQYQNFEKCRSDV